MGKVRTVLHGLVSRFREQGQLKNCHGLFKKALSKATDDPSQLSYAYLQFLTEEGTLQELNTGLSTIKDVLKKQGSWTYCDQC